MSSFTSSSSGGRWIVLCVVAILLASELALRQLEGRLSIDLRHIRGIPSIAQRLTEGDGVRVLFLGNSLTREAVDIDVFQEESGRLGIGPLNAVSVFPDDSAVGEWIWVFNHFFVDPNIPVDVVVVGFARNHLTDSNPLAIERIAAFYSNLSDAPKIFHLDLPAFGERVEFLLAHFSHAFAHRERVSRRVLDALIPHYRSTSRRINLSLAAAPGRSGAARPSYARFARFTELVRQSDARLVLVAMPTLRPYELDPGLIDAARELGAAFVDLRSVDGLTPDLFRDALHLTPPGAALYSRSLAQRLSSGLREVER
jgi:hypothetical protein